MKKIAKILGAAVTFVSALGPVIVKVYDWYRKNKSKKL